MKTYIVLASIFLTFACEKEEDRAIESIKGDWKITAITTLYGKYDNLGRFEYDSSSIVDGQLGTFNFNSTKVSYNFKHNNKEYNNTKEWSLVYEKVKEGFTGKDQYTLVVQDQFKFDVQFGDQTDDAEKNATKATFDQIPTNSSGLDTLMTLSLEKQ